MIIVKSIGLTLLLMLVTGCSRSFHIAKIVPGKTSAQEVLHRLNEPLILKKSSYDPKTEIFAWDDVSVQVKNNVVTAVHRSPASHEKYMQFWKHHYQDENTNFKPVQDKGSKESYWQFTIPAKGINVIYDEKTDEVVRVIYYETH